MRELSMFDYGATVKSNPTNWWVPMLFAVIFIITDHQAEKAIDERSDKLEIDMEHLSSGNYFIRVVIENTSKVVQVVKQ
jgi:hypothetical protein